MSVVTAVLRFNPLSAALRQSGNRGMASHPINDYYLSTSRSVDHRDRWRWEICRKSTPLGIKLVGDGYQSDQAAKFAGKQALADFLLDLAREENRK